MAAGGSLEDTAKDVALGELFTHSTLMDRLDSMSIRETLDYALNMVHEQSVVVYLRHHYSMEVVAAFTGDKLYLVDHSLPTQERVDTAVKRVQKLTSAAKAATAPNGSKKELGDPKDGAKWRAAKALRLLQSQNLRQQHQLMFPPGFGSGFGAGRGNGPPGGGPGPTCFNCGLPGHISAKCPTKPK